MEFKITSRKIIVLFICIVIIGAVYAGFNQINKEKNALKIITMDLTRSEEGENFTVTAKIQNTGSNDIHNAELHFIFIKNNDIVDSEIQLLNLETNLEDTYDADFIDFTMGAGNVYKIIASIYLEKNLLDTKTITKQF